MRRIWSNPDWAAALVQMLAVWRFIMTDTPRLSVEKALEKLRSADSAKSKNTLRTEEMDVLDDEIKRLKAQRLRLDRNRPPSGS
jgi:hypothetical protein